MPRADALVSLKNLAQQHQFFRASAPVVYRSAHAVLDVLGGLDAEGGGTLAQMGLPVHAAVAAQFDATGQWRIHSAQLGAAQVPVAADCAAAPAWAQVIVALLRASEGDARKGASILIHSNIPQGAGQGSSAAVLAAVALALAEPRETPSPLAIAQRVATAETLAARGNASWISGTRVIQTLTCLQPVIPGKPQILRFSAQPHRFVGPVPLPENVRMLALDTGIRGHTGVGTEGVWVSGHTGLDEFSISAAMGMRIIEQIYQDLGQRHTPLHGYLANTSPLLYRQYFRTLLPRRLRGADFIRTYGALPEHVATAADQVRDRVFRVRTAVDHLIAEHEHAEQFLQAMEELAETTGIDETERQKILQRAGRLLLASHHSYRLRLELSCPQADWLVDRLMESGPDRGIYGARITGRGGGGTVAALLSRGKDATEALLEVMAAYQQMMGMPLMVTEG